MPPVYRLAIEAADRKDEVKITAALAKLMEEDPSLMFEHNADTQQMVLAGQGEIHLKVAIEKLLSKYGLKLSTRAPPVPYKETIRKSATSRGRHKRQSGGHGQFGDVVLEITPNPRGAGFVFHDRIKGGVVPQAMDRLGGKRRAANTSSPARWVFRWWMWKWRWSMAPIIRWIPPTPPSRPPAASP